MNTETLIVVQKGKEFEIIVQHDQANSDKLVECINCGDKVEMILSYT